MNETTYDSDGNIVEQIIDNGDGTGTKTVYENGEVVSTEAVSRPMPEAPSVQDVVARVNPQVLMKAIALAGTLTSDPEAFDAAASEVSLTNTAKEVIDKVNEAVQTAAAAQIPS